MPRICSLLVMLLPLFALARSAEMLPRPLPQDAYVWQRHWTPALLSAVKHSADIVTQWRVLAAESDGRGTLVPVAIDWNALAATGRPVVAVIRLDGSLARWDETALLAQVQTLAANWQKHAAAGIEIDFDCATARLASYASFLKRLREVTGIPRKLSITALPDWMSSPALEHVLAAADEAVLQVHAVRAPQEGLFDPDQARDWIDAFAARATTRFRVALPDYGARVVWGDNGRLLAIESESPKLVGGGRMTELMAMPEEVARLLRDLEGATPEHLAGIVWFRLPTDDDVLTWSTSTWRAVARGSALQTMMEVVAHPSMTPQVADILLVNGGNIDAELPRAIGLPAGCHLADGVNGYTLDERQGDISLRRLQTALLRAHHERAIGWMRCSRGTFDVRP